MARSWSDGPASRTWSHGPDGCDSGRTPCPGHLLTAQVLADAQMLAFGLDDLVVIPRPLLDSYAALAVAARAEIRGAAA